MINTPNQLHCYTSDNNSKDFCVPLYLTKVVGHFKIQLTITHIQDVCMCVCVFVSRWSAVIDSVPTDETIMAVYYHPLSEIAALIYQTKDSITDIFIKKGNRGGGVL